LWWSPDEDSGDVTLTAAFDRFSKLVKVDALQDIIAVLSEEHDACLILFLSEIFRAAGREPDLKGFLDSTHASEWEPIDTAPADGSDILFARALDGNFWLIGEARWLSAEAAAARYGGTASEYSDGWCDNQGEDPAATHWLPGGTLPLGGSGPVESSPDGA
jgi:hypothetical protein